tara:strand:+ start:81150 stop:82013 length:864 start_codon:yes stop_codon:yes gene_type:complete
MDIIKQKVSVGSYKAMTYRYGDGDNVIILLSGGPGLSCEYLLESHKPLAEKGFTLISWDQFGSGESEAVPSDGFYTIEHALDEMKHVVEHFHLKKFYVLGHSWGGMLGLDYCLRYPKHVEGFIAANTSFSASCLQRSCDRIRGTLDIDTQFMLMRHEAEGTLKDEEYVAVMGELKSKYVCRLPKTPDAFVRSAEGWNFDACVALGARSFATYTGSLRNYERIDQLSGMRVPTLLIQGEYDFIMPDNVALAHAHLPNSTVRIVLDCSHLPFFEDPEQYMEAIEEFLDV